MAIKHHNANKKGHDVLHEPSYSNRSSLRLASFEGRLRQREEVCIHPACAINYSEWTGKVSEPGGVYDRSGILRGSLLCCKCFDEFLPYTPEDDPGGTAHGGLYETRRVGGLPWWVT